MEGEQVSSPSLTFQEYADELCAFYMAMGVSCEEYWHGDPTRLKHYEKAHELKNEQRNQEMWLQGLYIHNAVGVVLKNAFAKKGETPEKYIQKPIRITPLTEREKQENAEKERQKIIANLTAWGKAWKKGDKNGASNRRTTGNDSGTE